MQNLLPGKTSEYEPFVALDPGNCDQPPLRLVEFAVIATFEIRGGYQQFAGDNYHAIMTHASLAYRAVAANVIGPHCLRCRVAVV